MKKYFPDLLVILIVAALVFLGVQKPNVNAVPRPSGNDRSKTAKVEKKDVEKQLPIRILREVTDTKSLKDRNIFAANGSYALPKPGGGAPGQAGTAADGSYSLIGILNGDQKKAVFKESTGTVVTLTVGKELSDGMTITRINDRSVELSKGKEKKELKLFNVKVPLLSKRAVIPAKVGTQ
jgi:hypothetical protein